MSEFTPIPSNERGAWMGQPETHKRFGKTHVVWNERHLNSRKRLGPVMDLVQETGATTVRALERAYEADSARYGLHRLRSVAFDLRRYTLQDRNILLSPEEAMTFVYYRVFNQSVRGGILERKALPVIVEATAGLYNIRHATAAEDAPWGIDWVLTDRYGNIRIVIQVRCDSFRNYSPDSPYVAAARAQYAAFTRANPTARFYFLYETDIQEGNPNLVDAEDALYLREKVAA